MVLPKSRCPLTLKSSKAANQRSRRENGTKGFTLLQCWCTPQVQRETRTVWNRLHDCGVDPQISNRGRYSISNINKQLPISMGDVTKKRLPINIHCSSILILMTSMVNMLLYCCRVYHKDTEPFILPNRSKVGDRMSK